MTIELLMFMTVSVGHWQRWHRKKTTASAPVLVLQRIRAKSSQPCAVKT